MMDVEKFAQAATDLRVAHEEDDTDRALELRALCRALLSDAGQKIGVVDMRDVKHEQIDEVWGQYIVRKKLTLVESDAGVGKSLAMLQLAAQISQGGRMFAPSQV